MKHPPGKADFFQDQFIQLERAFCCGTSPAHRIRPELDPSLEEAFGLRARPGVSNGQPPAEIPPLSPKSFHLPMNNELAEHINADPHFGSDEVMLEWCKRVGITSTKDEEYLDRREED